MIALTQPEAASVTSGRIKRIVSPKGVEAWLIEEHAVPLVAVEFSFEGGAAHDPEGRSGAAHMTAALLDEGAGDLTAQAFHEQLDEFAVEMRFSAGRDRIDGSLKTLLKHQDEAYRLLSLALTRPRFDADAVDRVKAQVLAGLRRAINDPGSRSGEAWQARAFAGHPYARPVNGTVADVEAADRALFVGMAASLLTRRGLKVSIVGAIGPDAAAAMVDRVFGGLPEGEPLAQTPETVMGGLGEVEVIPLDIPQSTIRFGMPGLLISDPDYVPANVLNHILGGGSFTSRIWQEVREKRGLAYSVSSGLYPFRRAGVLLGGTATKNERAKEALDVIKDEFARMAANGPTEEELDKAKRYLIGSYALRFDTSSKIARQLDGLQVNDLGIDYPDRRNAEYAAVTLADLRRVGQRLLADGRMLVAVAGKPVGM
ncbi:MAG: M16 family metallopeptidase [Beijerinckiaceae bacterium]